MRATLNQKNFGAGQIAKDLWGRTDAAKYLSGLKKLRNCFINKRGIIYNFPGTEVVLPWKFPKKPVRQIPFKFSFNEQYDLIFGDKYMHVIKNGSPVFFFQGSVGISIFPNGNNPTITIPEGSSGAQITGPNFANGMMCRLEAPIPFYSDNTPIPAGDFSYNCLNKWFILQNVNIGVNATTFTLNNLDGTTIDSTTWGAYGGNLGIHVVYEIQTPYAYTDLPLLKYAQSFDILQLRHGSYSRYQLSRLADVAWNLQINNAWPTLPQQASGLSASGGSAGVKYYYKISSFDLSTKEESLPCAVLEYSATTQSAISSCKAGQTAAEPGMTSINLVLNSTAGLVPGSVLYVSSPVSDLSSGKIFLYPLTPYTVGIVSGNIVQFYLNIGPGPVPPLNLVFDSGAFAYFATTTSTATQISGISNTNPIIITTTSAHGLTSGQEVTIQGTGIYGLDGLTFSATVLSANQLTLNGVNGANYGLSGFISSTSTIISPTTIISSNTPSIANGPVSIGGNVISPSTAKSDIVFLLYASASIDGPFGFIARITPSAAGKSFTFSDPGIPPDSTLTPKSYIPLFIGSGNYPSACNFYQQRLVEFATNNNPQGLYASVIGDYNDFTTRNPIQENDAILLDVWSNELQQIFDSADSGFLVLITDMGPMVAAGDSSGLFTPSTDLIKRYAFAGGSQSPRPLHIFKNIVYLEANQGAIRDLEVLVTPFYTYIDKSEDVSLFSEDLVSVSTITAWDYKLYPDSQIFAVRADGKALAITYFKEQEIEAFSWMDTNNGNDSFEDVVCVQEGTETFVYWSVNRTTGGWIERMNSRYYKDPTIDAVFTHGTVSYNGLIDDTVILSGSTAAQGVITATLTSAVGTKFSIGWQVNFKYVYGYDQYGNALFYTARMNITSVEANSITGTLFEAINPAMIGPTISDARICSNIVGGLWNLNGQKVSINADGFDIADPNNSNYPVVTVTNGQVVLPNGNAYGVINIGLPYLSDVQTLDIDEEKGETFMDKFIGVHEVAIKFLESGPCWVGPNFTEYLKGNTKMDQFPMRDADEGYLTPTKLFTGIKMIPMDTRYGFGGSFAIRNTGPHPMTILKIAPRVQVQS